MLFGGLTYYRVQVWIHSSKLTFVIGVLELLSDLQDTRLIKLRDLKSSIDLYPRSLEIVEDRLKEQFNQQEKRK